MNKKGSAEIIEFLSIYGWAILVVFVAIGALIYFKVIPSNLRTDVVTCNYLNEDFPVITQQKQRLLEHFDINTISIDISKAKTGNIYGNNGRECIIPTIVCNELFCNEVGMFVFVNYTEYREWLK